MPLESSLLSPARRRFLQISFSPVLLAMAGNACAPRPIYKYDEGFLADPRFNTGGELEHLVMTSHEDGARNSVEQLVLTSREAFMNTPVEEWKDMLPKGKVTVLYPAAGIHIMPLQLGYRIMRQDSNVDEVEFIYTEIDSNAKIGFEQQLAILEKIGLVRNINVMTKNYPDNRSIKNRFFGVVPHEMSYSFDAFEPSGKPHRITVVYALNMSGGDLFRKEYAKRADILISHDSESEGAPKEMVRAALKVEDGGRYEGKNNVILLAESEYVVGFIRLIFPNLFKTAKDVDFPNRLKLVRGPYGCEGTSRLMLMYLDKDFVNSEHGQRILSKYFG